MRPVLLVLLAACGGAAPAPGPAATQGASAKYDATVSGTCTHLRDCRCEGAGPTCEAELTLVLKTMDGVMKLQRDMTDAATKGSPEAGIVGAAVDLAHGVITGAMAVNLEAMTTMDCPTLCAAYNTSGN